MITLLILLYLLSSAGFWSETRGRDLMNHKALALMISLTWPIWLVTLGCMAIWEAL